MKTGRFLRKSTRPVRFCRFTENRPVEFKFFEIKILKKTCLHFKNFGQNRIKKYVVSRPGKIEQVCPTVKSEKRFDWFVLTHDHMGLILFLPYVSRTRATPPIIGGARIVDLCQVLHPSVFQPSASVSRHYWPIFSVNVSILDLFLLVRSLVHQF
jgi:hypothetical protein